MDDVRNESDERRSGNPCADPPPAGVRNDPPPLAVLPYRAPYDEASGPTVIDIFKGTAAVGLMLLFLVITLICTVLLIEQLREPEGDGYVITASATLTLMLLLGAWLSYRGARDCFTGALRRSAIRPENDHWSRA